MAIAASLSTSVNSDTNSGYHVIISGNLVFNNAQLVPTMYGTITDGEGIILDTNPNFTGQILVQNNTVYNSGGPGIESYLTANATITGNTVYGNNTQHTQAASDGAIFINQSSNNTVTNNITTAPNSAPPVAPVIASDTVNGFAPAATVTLNGTAQALSTVTIFDNSTQLGTTITNGSGAWTFTTGALANGSQSFTATATDSAGQVSPLSSALVVPLNVPVNLVANGNFATGDFTGWTLGGNYTSTTYGSEIVIATEGTGGSTYAADMGSMGADGTLSQTIATTPGQTYALSFWLQNLGSGGNDFSATWNGQNLVSLTNTAQSGYSQYTYTVTATGSTSALQFSAANGPSHWDLDNISLTASGTPPATTPVINAIAETPSSGYLNAGKTVTYTLTMNEAVTVNTAGGSPTLALNDGGTATYVGGSGTNALTFSYTVLAGQNTPDLMVSAVNLNGATVKDSAGNATNLSLTGIAQGSPTIDTTPPTLSSVAATAGSYNAGKTLTLTLNSSEAVTVTGTPTLTLNDGGTATYASGSGTSTLKFSYTVASGQNTSGLAVTGVNGTITDLAGNALSTTNLPATLAGVVIDTTTPPTVNLPVNLVANGNFATGDFTGWTLGGNYTSTTYGSEIVIATEGTGGSTYAADMGSMGADGTLSQTIATTPGQTYALSFWLQNLGSGGNDFSATWNGQNLVSLTNTAQSGYSQYTYTVTATGSTSALQFSAANGPSHWDLDNISLTASGTPPATTPVINAIAETPSSGYLNAGKTVTYTLTMNEAVTVNTAGGSPTLALNDGGTATYVGGSGTNALTFSYTVLAGQNTPDLMVSAVNLNGATVKDSAGNATNLSLTGIAQGSPTIDTTPPTLSSVAATAGSYNAGKTLTLTLNSSEAVTVTGTPTLTLNDGGTATYASGSGTSTLKFSYTVASGQNTSGLAVTGVNGTITDLAGNALSTTNLPATLAGVVIDTTTPSVSSVAASGSGITAGSGNLGVGSVVTLTVNLNEAVTVAGGTPTLTLNDGGTASYTGGSGSTALTFSYTVATGQNTADLAVTAVNLNAATVKNTGGTPANLIGAVGNLAGTLQIDTTSPKVAQVVASPGTGEVTTNHTVLITVDMSEAVTVTGTPTLLLNDGGTATYDATRSTANALVFDYAVGSRQVTTDLRVSGITLPTGSSIRDLAGNNAVLTGPGADLGLRINTATKGVAGPSGGNLTITNGAELELFGPSTANVSFSGTTGELKLDDLLAFTGRISGLTAADALDLSDINYGVSTKASFSGNTKGGTLTVTDGSHTAKIALVGNYLTSGWTLSSDGNGGTVVVDPPLSTSDSGQGANVDGVGDIFTQRLALFVHHMAATFADLGNGEIGTSLPGHFDSGSQSNVLVAQPIQQHSHYA